MKLCVWLMKGRPFLLTSSMKIKILQAHWMKQRSRYCDLKCYKCALHALRFMSMGNFLACFLLFLLFFSLKFFACKSKIMKHFKSNNDSCSTAVVWLHTKILRHVIHIWEWKKYVLFGVFLKAYMGQKETKTKGTDKKTHTHKSYIFLWILLLYIWL